MSLKRAMHQKPGQPGRTDSEKGEARLDSVRDEAHLACHTQEGSGRSDLLRQILSAENIVKAWKHVKANKGSAGVDGLSIEQTEEYLKAHWPRIRTEVFNGQYWPQAVRRVEIPKPGGGVRELGIPTVFS